MNSGVNSSICVRLNPASTDRGLPFVYRVAGLPLLTDREVKELEHLRLRRDRRDRQWAKEPGRIQADHLIYEGPGLVGGIRYQVECRSGPSGYILNLSNGSRFAIRSDGARITRLAGPAQVEILLGPVLILALALQGSLVLPCQCSSGPIRGLGLYGRVGKREINHCELPVSSPSGQVSMAGR